ncbi:MAG: hypothetical protein IPP68_06065 [Elusimicrobia bacterium]|nr:hypothetical protein [Elusimicrobiota bacterium]
MIWAGLVGAAVLLWMMARLFRPAVRAAEAPVFVLEKPPLPRELAPVAARLDRWREEGRLSRADFERLDSLIREDAASGAPSHRSP